MPLSSPHLFSPLPSLWVPLTGPLPTAQTLDPHRLRNVGLLVCAGGPGDGHDRPPHRHLLLRCPVPVPVPVMALFSPAALHAEAARRGGNEGKCLHLPLGRRSSLWRCPQEVTFVSRRVSCRTVVGLLLVAMWGWCTRTLVVNSVVLSFAADCVLPL